MNKTKSTTDNIVNDDDMATVLLQPFDFFRKELTDRIEEVLEYLKDKIFEETIKSEARLCRCTHIKHKHPINFMIFSENPECTGIGIEFPLRLRGTVTVAPEDEFFTTITSHFTIYTIRRTSSYNFATRKISSYNPDILEKLLKHSLADLDNKSFELFIETPDIFMSKPYLFSIEVKDSGIIEVEVGMYALDYYKMNLNFMDSNTNV